MDAAFGEDVDPAVLARCVGGGRGEGVAPVGRVGVCVARVREGVAYVWRAEGAVDGGCGGDCGGVGLEGGLGEEADCFAHCGLEEASVGVFVEAVGREGLA